jgi:hypothetical protein
MGETKSLNELLEEIASEDMGRGMVLMYGAPPDVGSQRFKPPEPSPVTRPTPGVQAMPPITHNPFTGEPVNLLEVLAQNAVLMDENKRLTDIVSKQLESIRELQRKVAALECGTPKEDVKKR